MTRRMMQRKELMITILERRIKSLKGMSAENYAGLRMLTVRELEKMMHDEDMTIRCTNVARDIRMLTQPGKYYDAKFDVLWRGQALWQIIDRYSERFLNDLVKGCIAPRDVSAALQKFVRGYEVRGGEKRKIASI